MIMTDGFRQEPAGHNFFTPGGVYTKCKGVYNKCCICAALCAANRTEKEQRRRMEQKRTAPRAQKTQPLTYREWKRRKQLRLARNWGLFLAGCALVVFLLTKGILWLLPHLHGADGPQTFAASAYDSTDYLFDADDARLVLVNANLPFDEEPSPTLDAADEAGTQLEAEAAQQYRSMAEAAQADANEHGTGYAADILSTDYTAQDTGFADTRAYQWLTAYAAEYGFILRYPEDRQAITGVVFEPWHWRYVGVENALAIRASGLSLEEFLAEQKAL